MLDAFIFGMIDKYENLIDFDMQTLSIPCHH